MKITIPPSVIKLLDTLKNNGFESYVVGGCVRDSLLNKSPKDWDITTSALPDIVIDIFENQGYKVIPTGLKHGTITIVSNGEQYEVTTYRVDGKYVNCRRPSRVEFTPNLKEDLSRRDFTINAMAYNSEDGLIDYFGGYDDLKRGIIKCVGDPNDRFTEDALRMLRGVRLCSTLVFSLSSPTKEAMLGNSFLLEKISRERIREEFNKILLSEIPSNGILNLIETDLIKYIIPELKETIGFEQHNPNHDEDVFNHIMSVLDNTDKDLVLRLSALLHDIGKPQTFTLDEEGVGHFYKHHLRSADMAEEILKRLKYDNKTIDQVKILVREHMSRYEKLRTRSIKNFINRVGIDNLDRLFKLQIADIGGSVRRDGIGNILTLKNEVERVLREKQPLTVKDLKINGYELMELGIPQGKKIGKILNELMEIVLNRPELNEKDKLLDIAKLKMD